MNDQTQTWTVLDLINWTRDHFSSKDISSARLDAELLLADALGCSRLDLYTGFQKVPDDQQREQFRAMVKRRAEREPLPYILGYSDFDGHRFQVTPDVLVPRPETEHLVLMVQDHLPENGRLCDVGCGSGNIACAVAKRRADIRGLLLDVSAEALQVAQSNIENLGLDEALQTRLSNLLDALKPDERFDALVANLPYIPEDDIDYLMAEVSQWEPRLALNGGEDGLDLIRKLIKDLPDHLNPGAMVALEVGAGQHREVEGFLKDAGLTETGIVEDLSGIKRVVHGILH